MNFERLGEYLEAMPLRGIPACEIAVAKDGETVYRKCVGYSDAEGTVPASERDIYGLFSATKVVTCVAAMRLVEEGRLRLDEPVSKYIPAYGGLTVRKKDGTVVPAENVLTVEHLFTMTSGMSYDVKTENILTATDRSTQGLVRAMAKDPLRFEPGTHYCYGLSHDVLAAVVEVVTGKRFSEYIDEIVFRPLGIRDMGFFPSEAQKARFSAMYGYRTGCGRAVPRAITNNLRLSDEYESGGAGLFGTVDEYMKLLTTLSLGGTTKDGYRLLRPETIRMMQQNRLSDDAWDDFCTSRYFGYGWGLCGRVHVDPVRSLSPSPIGEFGWGGAAGVFFLVDPENRVAFYYGQHVMGCSYIFHVGHPEIRRLVYEGLADDNRH